MHPELAPAPRLLLRRQQRIDAIAVRERQIARLQAQQRLELAALLVEDRDGVPEKYVADEVALAWGRSRRQAQDRLDAARVFADFPVVVGLVADGTWLIDHADAAIGELVGAGLDRAAQEKVLDLVLSRGGRRTPYELRLAVRTAIVVLFPEQARDRAERARKDRDVVTSSDAPGSASLTAYGPTADVAAMWASVDALVWPPAPDDHRTVAQRRFDTLRDLVCGRRQPGHWEVQLLVNLATVEGADDRPAEIPGFGPVPAPVAREAAAGGELRRVAVDERGRLVAVDPVVHRPSRSTAPVLSTAVDDDPDDDTVWTESDPEAPTAADLEWFEEHCRPALPEVALPRQRVGDWGPSRTPVEPGAWTVERFADVLRQLRVRPLERVDLGTERYVVPVRLKRHLVLRDRTCVFPGCTRRAETCDKDHLVPWPRGSTSEDNLADECEHHHHAKHESFTVERLPDGTFRWTTPTGRTYDRPPRPVLDTLEAWDEAPEDGGR
jgi:hypothetical protein